MALSFQLSINIQSSLSILQSDQSTKTIVTLFLAVVIPEGLNFRSSFITDTLPFIAAMWTQVLPSCRTRKKSKVMKTIITTVSPLT